MLGKVFRGTYVLVLTAMIVAWVVSLGKEVPAEPPVNSADPVHAYLTFRA